MSLQQANIKKSFQTFFFLQITHIHTKQFYLHPLDGSSIFSQVMQLMVYRSQTEQLFSCVQIPPRNQLKWLLCRWAWEQQGAR